MSTPDGSSKIGQERRSPLYEIHRAAGATFTDFANWQMPVRFSSDLAEHNAVRQRAGIFDLSHMGEIVIIGSEAELALDYALAGKLSSIAEGQAKYSLLLARDGGIIDDLVVYRTGADRFMIVANAANRETVAVELIERTAPFDVEIYDESNELALIAVQGPDALEILKQTPGFGLDAGPGNDVEDFNKQLSELGYYRSFAATFADHPVLVARTGYTGEDGFELYIAVDLAPKLWMALCETKSLTPCGLASRDTLRLEAGMPLYGNELNRNIFPAQAGLGRVVALSKAGEFVGRAAVERGPAEHAPVLVGLTAAGRRAPRAGYAIFAGDQADSAQVGTITSGALSPTLGYPIAMAYISPQAVSTANSPDSTGLFADVRGTRIPVKISPLPFYKRTSSDKHKRTSSDQALARTSNTKYLHEQAKGAS